MAKKQVRVLKTFRVREISGCAQPVQIPAKVTLVKSRDASTEEIKGSTENEGITMTEQDIQKLVGEQVDAQLRKAAEQEPTAEEIAKAQQDAVDEAADNLTRDELHFLKAVADSDNLSEAEKTEIGGNFLVASPAEREDLMESVAEDSEDGDVNEITEEDVKQAIIDAEAGDEDAAEFLDALGIGAEDEEDGEAEPSKEVKKAFGEVNERLSEAEARAAQAEAETAILHKASEVEEQFPHLPGKPLAKAVVLKAVEETMHPEVRDYILKAFKMADGACAMATTSVGGYVSEEDIAKAADGEHDALQAALKDEIGGLQKATQ